MLPENSGFTAAVLLQEVPLDRGFAAPSYYMHVFDTVFGNEGKMKVNLY